MKTIYTTPQFDTWFDKLRDAQGKRRIQARIDRMEDGYFGDVKAVSEAISELRFFFGPGYRIYFYEQNDTIIILLAGGDKSTQSKDIKRAIKLVEALKETEE